MPAAEQFSNGADGSLRAALRVHTADAHGALERTSLMTRLVQGDFPDDQYIDYLQRQLRVHVALEAPLRAWMPDPCSSLRLHKSDWLRSDLAAMHAAPDLRVLPPPFLPSHSAAMGTLYVLEGSTLGLQMVLKKLPSYHPARRDAGRFMVGYGQQTGRHWNSFVAQLDSVARPQWEDALQAACVTFKTFAQVFLESPVGRSQYEFCN